MSDPLLYMNLSVWITADELADRIAESMNFSDIKLLVDYLFCTLEHHNRVELMDWLAMVHSEIEDM